MTNKTVSNFVDLLADYAAEDRADHVIRELKLRKSVDGQYVMARGYRPISRERIVELAGDHKLHIVVVTSLVRSYMTAEPKYEPKVTVGDVLDEIKAIVNFETIDRKKDPSLCYRTSRPSDFFKEIYYIGTSGDTKGWRHNLRVTKFAGWLHDTVDVGTKYISITHFISEMMKLAGTSLSANAISLFEEKSGKNARETFLYDYVQFMTNMRAANTPKAVPAVSGKEDQDTIPVQQPDASEETPETVQSSPETSVSVLPELVGSAKQVAFAKKIRDAEHSKNPSNPMLYNKLDAAFWINFSGKMR